MSVVKTLAYDLVVIGGGSGGLQAAWDAATLYKAKVAVVDVQTAHGPPHYSALGGTCVNVGCVPKKLFVTGAKFYEDFKDAKGFGWSIEASEVQHSWPKLIEAKNRAIKNINESYEGMFRDTEGLDFYLGWASFEDKNTVVVRSEKDVASPVTTRLTAGHTLIASGGWPFIPAFPGSDLCITSNEAFYLPECPKRTLIVGGGFIAVEFASIFQSYKPAGGEVHIAYRGDLFLRGFDISCREEIRDQLKARGVNLHFNQNPAKIELQANGEKLVTFESGNTMVVDCVMYATGRVPNTGSLNLDKVGVKLSKSGAVVVNNFSQTSTENIYAIGDVTERITLTPVAINEGSAFVSTVFGKKPKEPNHKNVASAVFTIPQIGTCGLTEDEAAKQYDTVRVYQTRDTPLMHQLTGNEHKKYMLKVVVNDADNAVVGIHIVAPDAAEMIQFVGILLKIGVKVTDLWDTIGVHPTTAEDILSMRDPKYFFVKGVKVDTLPAANL